MKVEIEEYHDYEKAAAAYSEAIRCLNKKIDKGNVDVKKQQQQQFYLTERQEQLRETLEIIQRFLDIKMFFEEKIFSFKLIF